MGVQVTANLLQDFRYRLNDDRIPLRGNVANNGIFGAFKAITTFFKGGELSLIQITVVTGGQTDTGQYPIETMLHADLAKHQGLTVMCCETPLCAY